MHKLAALDHQYVWHPFTQMQDWLKEEPIVIESGTGAVLRDVYGNEYLDANSSIWTNLHGHNHPVLNQAIAGQLGKIAHSSSLGLANGPASILGQKLLHAAQLPEKGSVLMIYSECIEIKDRPLSSVLEEPGPLTPALSRGERESETEGRAIVYGRNPLAKVFYSDDGSTAMEAALKLSYEHTRRTDSRTPRFVSLNGSYHGDTIGAVSLGHIDLFRRAFGGLLFPTESVMAPCCYRCPYNRAKPERADARDYRKCNWECIGEAAQKFQSLNQAGNPATAMVIEPLMQGAAGMIAQPRGWLKKVKALAGEFNFQLIFDEVMTAFGRVNYSHDGGPATLFAGHAEQVQPDFLALAKGLTGGYLPMGATLTTEKVFQSFLGEYHEFKTFFHGHSYTGNQLGAAAAIANLELLSDQNLTAERQHLAHSMRHELQQLWQLPQVGDIRQAGMAAGIELVKDWTRREPFPLETQAGIQVCRAMRNKGVLTRPIGNVIVIMPPFCTTPAQLHKIVAALHQSIAEVMNQVT